MDSRSGTIRGMKSIHFNQVPTMRGRLTMPFTDVMAINFKSRELEREAEAALRRIGTRRNEDIDDWARGVAKWIVEADFGEYE
jgi:hypothetical protein